MYVYKCMVLLCKVHSHDLCNDEVKCTSQLIVLCTIELSEACNLHYKLYTFLLIHVWQLFTPDLVNMPLALHLIGRPCKILTALL